jgi:Zn-dependent alcohol dehydrogenase
MSLKSISVRDLPKAGVESLIAIVAMAAMLQSKSIPAVFLLGAIGLAFVWLAARHGSP